MGAWIEIQSTIQPQRSYMVVAPHDGCVDWNIVHLCFNPLYSPVAPHDGCVDWNLIHKPL